MIQNKKWVQRLKNGCNEKEMGARTQKWVQELKNGCKRAKMGATLKNSLFLGHFFNDLEAFPCGYFY